MHKAAIAVITGGLVLAGCATAPTGYPVEATRYHYDPVLDRGTVVIEPGDAGPPPLEYQAYAAAVHAELLRIGFADPGPGVQPRFRVTVTYSQTTQPLPRRRSPVSIGLGGGGFSGGGYRGGGGVGLGGGVSFPVGGGGGRLGTVTQLSVRLRRGPDAVWEGQARTLTETRAGAPTTDAVATRLARALFGGFPGESGRTIEVR